MKAQTVYEVTVGPADTDSYNIVHHPMYFVWFEQAIYRYITEHPADFAARTDFTIVGFQCKFSRPAKLHDKLAVSARPKPHPAANGNPQFEVRIVNALQRYPVLSANVEIRLSQQTESL